MSSRRYVSNGDPDAEANYSVRADARLRMAFLGREVAQWGEGYVRMFNDQSGPGFEYLHGVLDLEELLARLKEEAALHLLASGGTHKELAETLGISEQAAEKLYGEAWTERQAQHARTDDRTPLEPRDRRGPMYDVTELDAWAAVRNPHDGNDQVSAGLVFPENAGDEVRTDTEVKDAREAAEKQAETDAMVAAYLANRETARLAALKRMARKPGLAHSALWTKDSGPMSGPQGMYVVARDGRYLGIVKRTFHDSATVKGVRWHVDEAEPKVSWEQQQHPYEALADAISFLDRNSLPPAAEN
jgi:hypothetical protein